MLEFASILERFFTLARCKTGQMYSLAPGDLDPAGHGILPTDPGVQGFSRASRASSEKWEDIFLCALASLRRSLS